MYWRLWKSANEGYDKGKAKGSNADLAGESGDERCEGENCKSGAHGEDKLFDRREFGLMEAKANGC
jgi:hypothetical protein